MDGKTKNPQFQEMFGHALDQKHRQARTILCDRWYASADNLKVIHRRQRMFFTTLKSTRLVSLSKEEGSVHLDVVEWTPTRLTAGVLVKVQQVPVMVRFFKLVAPDGAIAWVMTTDLKETLTAPVTQDPHDVRWHVEERQRGRKHLTGTEKCQGRGARAQRTHLACGYHAWVSLNVKAKALGQTR